MVARHNRYMTSFKNVATAAQIKKIQTLKRALGWDDDLYREILDDRYGVKSSKQLTIADAANFIETFEKKAIECGVWQKQEQKHADKKRKASHYASVRQIRLIEALWGQVTRQTNEEDKTTALRKFIRRIVDVDDLRFVLKKDVERLVKALEQMGANYER